MQFEICAHSLADKVFGYEPKDRGFESLWAYHGSTRFVKSLVDFVILGKNKGLHI